MANDPGCMFSERRRSRYRCEANTLFASSLPGSFERKKLRCCADLNQRRRELPPPALYSVEPLWEVSPLAPLPSD